MHIQFMQIYFHAYALHTRSETVIYCNSLINVMQIIPSPWHLAAGHALHAENAEAKVASCIPYALVPDLVHAHSR